MSNSPNPMDCHMPDLPVPHCLPEFAQVHVHGQWCYRFILCCLLLLLPSVFPSIRVFYNELAIHIRWPKYWSFSFRISPSNECSGLIPFRIDCFALLESKGLSGVFSGTTVRKHQWWSAFFMVQLSHSWGSLIAQLVKNPPAMQETLVWFLDQEDPLEMG